MTEEATTMMEKHYSVAEVAAWWGLSDDAVRRRFAEEPGVLRICQPRLLKGARQRVTLRIPASVLARVYQDGTSTVAQGRRLKVERLNRAV